MLNLNEIAKYLTKYKKFRIVFVGDSITSTEWVHPNWREIVEYVIKDRVSPMMNDWKEASWGIRGINCGYDGSTTGDILEKTDEVLEYKPDMIVCMIGANDGVLGVSLEEHKNNINKINSIFSKTNYFCYLTDICSDNEISLNKYLPYVEVDKMFNFGKNQFVNLFEISKSFDAKKIFTFISEADIPEENIRKGDRDFWHPNQLGNAYIAKVILKEVFGLDFDPEKYMADTLAGEKYPGY